MHLAHVKWFVDSEQIVQYPTLAWHEILFIVAGVGAFVGLIYLISNTAKAKALSKKIEKSLKGVGPWVPTITRVTLGLLLIINSWNELFYAPNVEVVTDYQQFINWLLGGLGVLIIFGVLVRSAAITLAIIYFFSFFAGEPLHVLEHIEYLGLAGYLALAGGGMMSLKVLDAYDINALSAYRGYAKTFIRVGTGLGLSILAFSEKLLNFSDAHQFLNNNDWNFLSTLGISDRMFIIIAGVIELGVGLCLIFNIGPKIITFTLLGLFVTTAVLLGVDEIIGHMFALGVVLAVWTNYPQENKSIFNRFT